MALVRYSPLSSLDALNRQINRLFEEDSLLGWKEANNGFIIPSVEISETEEAINLKLEIPGMDAKDLDIKVTKEDVSISGERKQETKTENQTPMKNNYKTTTPIL